MCKGKNIFNIRSYPKFWSNKIFRQNKMFYVPTYPIFGVSVIGNTHIILFGLTIKVDNGDGGDLLEEFYGFSRSTSSMEGQLHVFV